MGNFRWFLHWTEVAELSNLDSVRLYAKAFFEQTRVEVNYKGRNLKGQHWEREGVSLLVHFWLYHQRFLCPDRGFLYY